MNESIAVVRLDDRYVAKVDEAVAALTVFLQEERKRVFVHTETEPGFEKRGIATDLVRRALQSTVDDGDLIVAICPFVARFVHEHDDFDEWVRPRPTRAVPPRSATR